MVRPRVRYLDNSLPYFFPFVVTFLLCGGAFLMNKMFGK
jgi:hypothetical protein